MKLDGNTIEQLYKNGVLTDKQLRRINIINSLQAGIKPALIADKFKISKVAVYDIKRKIE